MYRERVRRREGENHTHTSLLRCCVLVAVLTRRFVSGTWPARDS